MSKIKISHNDGHNYPTDLEFDTWEDVVDHIKRKDPMSDPAEFILQSLKEDGEYMGCDTWIVESE